MAIKTRSSALAIKVESTEGTPVIPAAGTDFIALQDDFSFTPAFDTLENAEIRASIGKAPSILGLENPSASFSHYLRHSGVEATPPNYRYLLKAAFGAEDSESTEYDTVNSSTTTVINVNTGEGATFIEGQALLIKDGTNGYSIRPVKSISSDALTLPFALSNAPLSGVNLGKAVTYYPANSGHPSLTMWHYLGNSSGAAAIQMMAGGRVVGADISFAAGELINVNYSLEGSGSYFDPITIASADRYLDFSDGSTKAAVIAAGTYKDPHQLADALQTAMNAVSSGITVVYSDTTGKFTIAKTSGTLSLLWLTGTNTANTVGDKIGFDTSANDTGSLTYTSDTAQSWTASYTPSFDSSDPLAAKDNVVFLGDSDDNVCFAPSSVSITLGTPKTDILSVCEVSGKAGSIINERTVEINVVALLPAYDADMWKRFRAGTDTAFMYNFGVKSGGNWVAGKCGCAFAPRAKVTNWEITDEDGLATLNLTLVPYVSTTGQGEFYISFV